MRIHFVFIGEGSSDEGLIPHLENLCVELGADEVTGTAVDFRRLGIPVGKSVRARLDAAVQLEPEANLFLIHRDADGRDPAPRHREILEAVAMCGLAHEWVGIVPVQETEAWLLLDEAAIRTVAGRPIGRNTLDLPRPQKVEELANPKEKLQQALVDAGELSGRRLAKFRKNFPDHRRLLLTRLHVGGPLSHVLSWTRLRDDLAAAISRLTDNEDVR
jgi:hypothetical protein